MLDSLKKIIAGTTAIPYNDELIEVLEGVCASFRNSDKFDCVDTLAFAFVTEHVDTDFRKYVNTQIKNAGYKEFIPDSAFLRLEQYAILTAIHSEQNSLIQSVLATMLMNSMLLARCNFNRIPNQNEMLSVYEFHLSKFLRKKDTIAVGIDSNIRKKVPQEDCSISELQDFDVNELRSLIKESTLYRNLKILSTNDIKNIKNPYRRVYVALNRLFDNMPYLYYNINILEILNIICEEQELKIRKKFGNIVLELQTEVNTIDFIPFQTSVILKSIKDSNYDINENVRNQMLPVREFAIYLYFEFLTEYITISIKN